MELRQLEFVVVLADELHFGRAAERLHISTSVLSEQVRRLERELGVELFRRTTHRVALSSAGAAFLPDARKALSGARRAASAARETARTRPLRVITPEVVFGVGAQVVAAIGAALPGVPLYVDGGANATVLTRFAADDLDLAVYLALPGAPLGQGLAERVVQRQRWGVCVAASSPLARREEVDLRDLAEDRLMVAPPIYDEYNAHVRGLFADARLALRPQPPRTTSIALVMSLEVVHDRCAVIVPDGLATAPGVTWRPLAAVRRTADWTMVWSPSTASPCVVPAVEAVTAHAERSGWLSL